MKDKQAQDVVYALADYKQLVLAYRTKHAELVKAVALWKISVIWLAAVSFAVTAALIGRVLYSDKLLRGAERDNQVLNSRAISLSEKLQADEQQLGAAKDELNRKDALIQLLEKNISTTSKKLLEQLLTEQGSGSPASQVKGAHP